MNNRLINTKVAGGGGGCTDIVDNYDPFGGNGLALYQLNGNANDVSGNYNGTATNVTYGTGVFGQAGVFNGSSSKVTITNFQALSTFSVSMWIKASSQGQDKVILSPYNGSSFDANTLAVLNGGTQILIFSNSFPDNHSISASDTSLLFDNNWNNFTYTVDLASNTLKMYINGVEKTTTRTGTTLPQLFSNIKLGVRWDDYSLQFFNGSIDQVRIFNTALDPLEVEALYTEELCICDGTVDTLDILGDGSCVATYQLDGNANDLSGNYSGTPTNVSYGVGEFDLAGVFNQTTYSYINGTLNTIKNLPSDNFTLSLWAYKSNSSGNTLGDFLFSNMAHSNNRAVHIFVDGTSSKLVFRTANVTINEIVSPNVFPSNIWVNIVCVCSVSNGLSMYLDGVNVSNGSYLALDRGSHLSSVIGNYSFLPNADLGFIGSIDQVRIFNKALNSTEVTTLYNETACTKVTREAGATQILGDSSCIAYYKLDGTAVDETGTYNGTFTNPNYGNGEFDLAGLFDGSIRYSKNDNLANEICKGYYSVNAWVNTLSSSVYGTIIHLQDDNNGHLPILAIATNNGNWWIDVRTNSSSVFSSNNIPITFNSWNMITVVLHSGGARFYLNGSEVASASFTPVFTTNTSSEFSIGRTSQRWIGWTGNYFDGSIDQIRVFNKAVSPSEVTTLYNEGI